MRALPEQSDGPFDADALVRWAEMYGHPELWAKAAQAAHAKAEVLRALCAEAAEHLRTLPVQSDVKDGLMAQRLEEASRG